MESFLAKRFYGRDDGIKGGSRPAIIIATVGTALGLAVMIVAIAVTGGFKGEIREKVAGFSQHMRVTNYRIGTGTVEIIVGRIKRNELEPLLNKTDSYAYDISYDHPFYDNI
jgi:ABC-type lipoprotein release transport system permease subunit